MVIWLQDPRSRSELVVGGKAANLARAAAAGMPVLPGFVVPAGEDLDNGALVALARTLGPLLAVRSSAVGEDNPAASHAGVYESLLDVPAEQVPAAVARVRTSATGQRATAYRSTAQDPRRPAGSAGPAGAAQVAVLVQPMLHPTSAGVAFGANPMTGDRDEALVTAVTGVAESVVAGVGDAEQWSIRDGHARLISAASQGAVLRARQARVVADLCRRATGMFGAPQDIEWALAGRRLILLQTRPMTALPPPVSWPPPGRGVWLSSFRIGEWLPEPVTPLFASWLLPKIHAGFQQGMAETAGGSVTFSWAIVNQWYFTRPNPSLRDLPSALVASRGRLLPFVANALIRPGRDPAGAAAGLLDQLYRRWRDELLPSYRTVTETDPTNLTTAELIALVDQVALIAGRSLWSLAVVGGAAWKMERALTQILSRHGLGHIEVSRLLPTAQSASLLNSLDRQTASAGAYSLDWYHPLVATPDVDTEATIDLAAARAVEDSETLQEQVLEALPAKQQGPWAVALETSRQYAAIREHQAHTLTLGWPLLRRCVHQLGVTLSEHGALSDPTQIHFLTAGELTKALQPTVSALDPNRTAQPGVLTEAAQQRKTAWQQARTLQPPLVIGTTAAPLARLVDDAIGAGRPTTSRSEHERESEHPVLLTGQPASPGRATGPVRVIHGLDDFPKVEAGEVLVARSTAPAWTPLFRLAVAVITDGGTVAAHASLIAREYGLPAVVATGTATRTLTEGMQVTVDGSRGTVRRADQLRAAAS